MTAPAVPPATQSPQLRGAAGAVFDCCAVAGITLVAALLSQPWTGFNSPDSEFYASLALFGNDVAGRALDAAYLWTRLGYIVPVRALVTLFDPWVGFEIWRWFLIAVIVTSTYLIVRLVTSRGFAVFATALVALSTMVLGFVGNTYLTGTILAVTWALLAAGCIGCADRLIGSRRWLAGAVAGICCGWLVMLNPYALALGGSLWAAIRLVHLIAVSRRRWANLVRDLLLLVTSAGLTAGLLLLAGSAVFPGRNWLQTYLDWNDRLDYSVFVGDPLIWQRDIALLVPVLAVAIAAAAVALRPSCRWPWVAVGIASANLLFTAGIMLAVPGPWLEAQHYVAKLWPAALVAIVVSFASIQQRIPSGHRTQWISAGLSLCIGIPAMAWSGRWDATLSVPQGLGLAFLGLTGCLAAFLLASWTARSTGARPVRVRRGLTRVATVSIMAALLAIFVLAQVLQNGRGALGIYRQYPLRAAYVDYQVREQMASKIALQQWLLARTADGDRIGLWTDPDRLTGEVAAMQLWGYYNLISTSPQLSRDELKALEGVRPTAIAMYAPTREQIDTFYATLPPWGLPSPMECTSEPFLGIGSERAWLCLTHLRWVG